MATPFHSTTPQNDGSVERQQQTLWIWKDNTMIEKEISFVPDIYGIFDEVLVTVAGDKQEDLCVKIIKVRIDVSNTTITVFYNGVPRFDHSLWSKVTTDYTISHRDKFMLKHHHYSTTKVLPDQLQDQYHVQECYTIEKWTMVTFKLDLAKYGMECLEDDTVALMKRRVVDLAGCLGNGAEVELDGTCVPVRTFEDYVKLYPGTSTTRIYEKVHDRWDICVCLSDGKFKQVSFLNYVATMKGGSQVDYITNQITSHLERVVNFEPDNIKSYLWVFVNAFDSQTKENLTTTDKGIFGSACELTHEFLKRIAKPYLRKRLSLLKDNPDNQYEGLKKTAGKRKGKLNIALLEDANMAATNKSRECTLILTQGDSAKAFAMSGLAVLGQDYYGVLPLKDKLLNVREASHQKLQENTEIQNIKEILGLQDGKVYENVEELRYGHLMIMADEDHDGSRIKGLLINFFHTFWPSLLKVPHFMRAFIKDVKWFYIMHEYVTSTKVESLGNEATKYIIKYFKGLGTTEDEAQYFGFDHHIQDFVWANNEDHDAIELAFSKTKIEARMDWLRAPQAGTYTDSKKKSIRYRDFINEEFKQCVVADLRRSIPSVVDGLTRGQRKILFCAFKKPIIQEIKVAEFSHYVSEHSAYHHGEASLVGTIIGMAQNYVGSNNINLLQPIGQYGTRYMGGKDHADDRCIFTRLSPITRYLFYEADELCLYLNDDGQSIEPEWFMPIIPMVLVNGIEGTVIGCSSFIPNYNPRAIIANLKRLLHGEAMLAMIPWYKGFKGDIEPASNTEYTTKGKWGELEDGKTLRITELPVGRWTREYKQFLKAAQYGKDQTPFIKAYTAHNDKTTVDFTISMSENQMNTAKKEEIWKIFKLTTTLSTANMYLFDKDGAIKKYETPEEILRDFFCLRLDFYKKRMIALTDKLGKAILLLENKVRYINEVKKGDIDIFNREDDAICADLKANGFKYLPKETEPTIAGREEYDYLLSMTLASFTNKKIIEQFKKEMDEKKQELDELKKSTPESLWLRDLEALEQQLEEKYPLEEHMAKINLKSSQDDDIAEEAPKNKAPAKRTAAGPQRASKKKQRCN